MFPFHGKCSQYKSYMKIAWRKNKFTQFIIVVSKNVMVTIMRNLAYSYFGKSVPLLIISTDSFLIV